MGAVDVEIVALEAQAKAIRQKIADLKAQKKVTHTTLPPPPQVLPAQHDLPSPIPPNPGATPGLTVQNTRNLG